MKTELEEKQLELADLMWNNQDLFDGFSASLKKVELMTMEQLQQGIDIISWYEVNTKRISIKYKKKKKDIINRFWKILKKAGMETTAILEEVSDARKKMKI